ncbi:PQ-loop domain-containing transporter [Amycolatopsis decaplanina]|uniref:MtN3/saliva-related transmembrane protein, conserved region n=1 Tax=Amycolatopsis decaplanina DSM 44594 TaxID=1284240 RepID=M2YSK4_9PSEU|nr:PQ-loop domain-containing transporter [Amycolatopsis decaplanina]EME51768.1 MtN3/saliva-related transmembrane protein, conserved region [Amycolatopsis decaplanina DSM 44594]
MSIIDLVGYVAGLSTAGSLVPQIFRILRTTRSADQLSIAFLVIQGVAIGLWLVYGLRFGQAQAFQYAQIAAIGPVLILVCLTVRFGNRSSRDAALGITVILGLPLASQVTELPTAQVGWVAVTATTTALVPQVLRLRSVSNSNEISGCFMAIFAARLSLWFIYGVSLGNTFLWAAQVVTAPALLYLAILVARRRRATRHQSLPPPPIRSRVGAVPK